MKPKETHTGQTFVELSCSTVNYCFSILIGITKVMEWGERQPRVSKGRSGVAVETEKTEDHGFQYTLHICF